VNPLDDGEFSPDPPAEELRYPLYRFLGEPVFLSEKTGVILLLSVAAALIFLFLVYSAVYRRELFQQIRIGLGYSWVVPLLFGALWGSFFVSERLLGFLLTLPGIPPGAGRYNGLGQIIFMGLVLFYLLTGFIHLLPIPKLPFFYGNTAVVIALCGFLAVLAWDITRMPPALWSFLWIILGRFLNKKTAVYGCALLYLVQPAAALFSILRANGYDARGITGVFPAGESLGFVDIGLISLLISLFFLPPLLLLLRGNALNGATSG
jgi:hypothetical protein